MIRRKRTVRPGRGALSRIRSTNRRPVWSRNEATGQDVGIRGDTVPGAFVRGVMDVAADLGARYFLLHHAQAVSEDRTTCMSVGGQPRGFLGLDWRDIECIDVSEAKVPPNDEYTAYRTYGSLILEGRKKTIEVPLREAPFGGVTVSRIPRGRTGFVLDSDAFAREVRRAVPLLMEGRRVDAKNSETYLLSRDGGDLLFKADGLPYHGWITADVGDSVVAGTAGTNDAGIPLQHYLLLRLAKAVSRPCLDGGTVYLGDLVEVSEEGERGSEGITSTEPLWYEGSICGFPVTIVVAPSVVRG